MNAPRPPLPDIDWTEAVEKTEDVLRRYGLEPDSVLGSAACDVVREVWPILHAAAQPLDLCAPFPRRAEQRTTGQQEAKLPPPTYEGGQPK